MIALTRSTRFAILFGVIGIAVGMGITLAVVQAQEEPSIQQRAVEDSSISWPFVFREIQETIRPTIKEKATLAVGEQGTFYGDARGGDKPYQFKWNFDDGYTSSLQNVTHSFESPGKHKVQLTATDAVGREGIVSTTVEVFARAQEASESAQMPGQ